MNRLALLAMLLVLSGCGATTFEKAPLPELACDSDLVGRWLSVAGRGEVDGEVELHIDDNCNLDLVERDKPGKKPAETIRLHVGQSGRQRYAWVDAGWAQLDFSPDNAAQEQDVFVLRYSVNRDRLELQVTDDKAIAHLIIDGRITGDVARTNSHLVNRITGGPHPEVLALPGVFDREKIRFRRATGEASP